MTRENILIVEDETDIVELIRYNLLREGYQVRTSTTGENALQLVQAEIPDLILLDLMLPGIDGLTICRQLKTSPEYRGIPIVMVTAKGDESDIVTGLEMGADDYITKPFSVKVLLARVKSVLRRLNAPEADENEAIDLELIRIVPDRFEVFVSGNPIKLTQTEFKILHALARRAGRVFTRYQIVDLARGSDAMVTDRSVDVHIASLRRKLGDAGVSIETVHGVGYRCKE